MLKKKKNLRYRVFKTEKAEMLLGLHFEGDCVSFESVNVCEHGACFSSNVL